MEIIFLHGFWISDVGSRCNELHPNLNVNNFYKIVSEILGITENI